MRTVLKRSTAIILTAIILPMLLNLPFYDNGLTGKRAEAAQGTAKLAAAKMTIAVNDDTEVIMLDNHDETAKYSYQSSNKKIVAVDEEFGILNGMSKGTATVTVTETKDGISRELGKVKVTVAGASLNKECKVGVSGNMAADIRVPINYENAEAVYSYKSSDPKTVDVNQSGNLYSKKYGYAYISVTEKYKGKTTNLGKIKVNVVKPEPTYDHLTVPIRQNGHLINYMVSYKDTKKTYKFTSTNKNILDLDLYNSYMLFGKDYGTVKVNITETYQNKTRKIGSTTVEVVPANINPDDKNIELEYGKTENLSFLLSLGNLNDLANYTCKPADSSIISVVKKPSGTYSNSYLTGVKKGKTTLAIYEEYKGHKTKIGTLNATVKETVTKFTFDPNCFHSEDDILSTTFYLNEENSFTCLYDYLIKEPNEDMSSVSFSSSDENVLKVDDKGVITLVSKGTAIITATCENLTAKLKMTVE